MHCIHKQTGLPCAVKVIKKAKIMAIGEHMVDIMRSELEALESVDHIYIARIL